MPEGIAVDTAIQRVVYTDGAERLIAAMDYDGSNHDVILTSEQNLQRPRAIILHPESRYVKL